MAHLLERPHRLVVRTSRCGRDNPGSTPGVDNFIGRFRERAGVVVTEVRFVFSISEHISIAPSGVAQWLACWAHNPKVRGSKPRSAITLEMLASSAVPAGPFSSSSIADSPTVASQALDCGNTGKVFKQRSGAVVSVLGS